MKNENDPISTVAKLKGSKWNRSKTGADRPRLHENRSNLSIWHLHQCSLGLLQERPRSEPPRLSPV